MSENKITAVAMIGFGNDVKENSSVIQHYLFHYRVFLKMLNDFDLNNESLSINIITRREIMLNHRPSSRHSKKIFYASNDEAAIQIVRSLDAKFVFIWNGSEQKYIIDEIRKDAIIPIFCELGWLPQAKSISFDFLGVNGNSSWANEQQTYNAESDVIAGSKWIASYKNGLNLKELPENGSILVPLQLENDSNIIHHSPFKTMQKLVEFVAAQFPDNEILLRPHPGNKNPELIKLSDNCTIVHNEQLYDMIQRSSLVIGINSTVLIEALILYKKVVALGSGIGCGKGVFVAEGTSFDPAYVISDNCNSNPIFINGFMNELISRRQLYYSDFDSKNRIRDNVIFSRILT